MTYIVSRLVAFVALAFLLSSCAGVPPSISQPYNSLDHTVIIDTGTLFTDDWGWLKAGVPGMSPASREEADVIARMAIEQCPYGRFPVFINTTQKFSSTEFTVMCVISGQ